MFAEIFAVDEGVFTRLGHDHEFGGGVLKVIREALGVFDFEIDGRLEEGFVFLLLRGRLGGEVAVDTGAPCDDGTKGRCPMAVTAETVA